jgi:hypothetical protein
MTKGQNIEYKSLKLLTGRNPAWHELAKDCVCFTNGCLTIIDHGILLHKSG